MNKILVALNVPRDREVQGFWITTKVEYQQFLDKLKELSKVLNFEDIELYILESEYITFSNIEEIIDCITVSEIDDSFAIDLGELLGNEYGALTPLDILTSYEEIN